MSTEAVEDHPKRKLFHSSGDGGIEWSRVIENLIPVAGIGLIGVLANFLLLQGQVTTLKEGATEIKAQVATLQATVGTQNSQIVALQTQMAGYLATQNQLNASVNDRMLYIERAMRTPAYDDPPYRSGQSRNAR